MGLLDLKVGKINKFQDRLKDIILIDLNEEEKYEYFNVIAYFHDFYNETDNVKKSYSNSLKYADSKVKRIYTYNKLLEISKKQKDYVSCIKYIQGIQDNADSPTVNKELLRDWVDYKFKLNKSKDVIYKIEDLLTSSITKKDEIFYKILLAKSS